VATKFAPRLCSEIPVPETTTPEPKPTLYGVDRFELDGLAGGGDAEKVADVGVVVDLVGGDNVAVDGFPMDLGSEVGKRVAQSVVEDANAGFVGCGAGLGVWSTKSSANSSSNRAKSPWPWTCSVLRRTTALAASASLWRDAVISALSGSLTACLCVDTDGEHTEDVVLRAARVAAAEIVGPGGV
jgi:hypothetical protein